MRGRRGADGGGRDGRQTVGGGSRIRGGREGGAIFIIGRGADQRGEGGVANCGGGCRECGGEGWEQMGEAGKGGRKGCCKLLRKLGGK